MGEITNTYINALLADATYALNVNGLNGKTGRDLADLLSSRMTPTVAQYIGNNFTVVTHIETNDVATSGFDATVWRENASGKIYLSPNIRGRSCIATFHHFKPVPKCTNGRCTPASQGALLGGGK